MEKENYSIGLATANANSYPMPNNAIQSKPQSELDQEIMTYSDGIERLETLLNQLYNKIDPISHESSNAPEQPQGKNPERGTSVGRRLNSLNYLFNERLDSLRGIINRIDL